jgi:hypothetical protein
VLGFQPLCAYFREYLLFPQSAFCSITGMLLLKQRATSRRPDWNFASHDARHAKGKAERLYSSVFLKVSAGFALFTK